MKVIQGLWTVLAALACLLCLPDRKQMLETGFSLPKVYHFHTCLSITHLPAQRNLKLGEIKFCLHPKKKKKNDE